METSLFDTPELETLLSLNTVDEAAVNTVFKQELLYYADEHWADPEENKDWQGWKNNQETKTFLEPFARRNYPQDFLVSVQAVIADRDESGTVLRLPIHQLDGKLGGWLDWPLEPPERKPAQRPRIPIAGFYCVGGRYALPENKRCCVLLPGAGNDLLTALAGIEMSNSRWNSHEVLPLIHTSKWSINQTAEVLNSVGAKKIVAVRSNSEDHSSIASYIDVVEIKARNWFSHVREHNDNDPASAWQALEETALDQ